MLSTLVFVLLAFVDIRTGSARGQFESRVTLARVGPRQIVAVAVPTKHRDLVALVDVRAGAVVGRSAETGMTVALVAAGSIDAKLIAASIVPPGALIQILAGFPVGGQAEALRAKTKHLAVAVYAGVRAATVATVAPVRVLAAVAVRGQDGAADAVARALVASRAVGALVLAGAVAVVQEALVVVDARLASIVKGVASLAAAHEGTRLIDTHLITASVSAVLALVRVDASEPIL